jgi:ABC-type transport system involved in multi-copper enzyme maturation permease subunit
MAAATVSIVRTCFAGTRRRLAAFWEALADNPVLVRGIRTRMRGGKAYSLLAFYVFALGVVMLIVYLIWSAEHGYGYNQYRYGYGGPPAGRELGRVLYYAIFVTQGVLVFLIAPLLSSGALTLEWEQRTYEMLICTRLSARNVVVGKILSGWLFLLMLITASLPMAGIAMLMGGISPGEIILAYLSTVLVAYLFCAIGVFWSAVNTRSAAAAVAALGTVIAFGLITSLVAISVGGPQATPFSSLNPIMAASMSARETTLFSLTLPNWMIGLPLLALGGALATLMAAAKVKGYRPHSQLATRLVMLAVVWGGLFVIYGASFASPRGGYGYSPWAGAGLTRGSMIALAGITAGLLMLLTMALASGDRHALRAEPPVRALLAGFSPRQMFSGSLPGGVAFSLFMAAGAFALLGLSKIIAGPQPMAIMRYWVAATVMSMVVLASYGCLAFLLSLLSSRIGAGVLGAVLVILAWVGPSVLRAFTWELGGRHLLVSETIYLSPPMALFALAGERVPVTWAGMAGSPLWAVTAGVHLIAAVIFLALAQAVWQSRRRRQAVAARKVVANAA